MRRVKGGSRFALSDLVAFVPFFLAAWLALTGWTPQESWRVDYDLQIYLQAGQDVLDGTNPYLYETSRELGFTYPPFAALPFALLAQLPFWLVRLGWILGIAVIGLLLLHAVMRRTALASSTAPRDLGLVALAATLAAATEPVYDSMVLGQLSPYVAAAGILAFTGPAARGWWAGLGGAVKLTPLGLLPAMLGLKDRLVRIGWGVAAAVLLTGIGIVALPAASIDYFTNRLWDTRNVGRVGRPSNISLASIYGRMGLSWDASAKIGLVLTGLLAVAWLWEVTRRPPHRLDLAIGAGCLVCLGLPVTWSHHALAVTLAVAALALRRHVLAAALLAVLWSLPVQIWAAGLDDVFGDVFGSLRTVSLVCLVVATAWVGVVGPPPHARR
jgi:alpha-1,2-mannosyltransferase